jgi:hypothetical protein
MSYSESANSKAQTPWVMSPDYFRKFMDSEPLPVESTMSAAGSYPGNTAGSGPPVTDPLISIPVSPPPIPPPSQSHHQASQQQIPRPGNGGGTTQESIFKTISKRLSLLERNASLSYKYIEEQSRAYHEAFRRVEILRLEGMHHAVGECNRTVTKAVRQLVCSSEMVFFFFFSFFLLYGW